ncbi:hypothetical protein, partial [Nonomuraea sp. NPDC049784]|uniref:hypothetical protein n=1 Tax=Nonomuraea sp. NPDC049784 TaxID=3154361 RepID=UPI0033DF9906
MTEIVHCFLAEGVQEYAWEVGEYADYYAALQATGQPYDAQDAARVAAGQQRVGSLAAALACTARPGMPAIETEWGGAKNASVTGSFDPAAP